MTTVYHSFEFLIYATAVAASEITCLGNQIMDSYLSNQFENIHLNSLNQNRLISTWKEFWIINYSGKNDFTFNSHCEQLQNVQYSFSIVFSARFSHSPIDWRWWMNRWKFALASDTWFSDWMKWRRSKKKIHSEQRKQSISMLLVRLTLVHYNLLNFFIGIVIVVIILFR